MDIKYSTEARSVGAARDGRAYLTDGTLEIEMSLAKELGGTGVRVPTLSNFSPWGTPPVFIRQSNL